MNRHQRRAAMASGNAPTIDPVVAVHEAGHAVARIMTAPDLGFSPEFAITYIEIGSGRSMGASRDGRATLISQAVTFGPTLSADIQSVFNRITAGVPRNLLGKYIAEAISVARSEGVDVEKWLRARMLIQICGSAAEACHTGRDLESVWNSYASESDFQGAVQDGVWADLDPSDITKFINEGMDHAVALVCQPNAQNAIYVLANALPNSGRLTGRQVASITRGPLAETDGAQQCSRPQVSANAPA